MEVNIPNYATLFHTGIVRSAEYVLARIESPTGDLRVKDKKRALHLINYALKLDEAWQVARALLLAMAPKMEQAGYRDEWIAFLERGIDQSDKLGDLDAEGELRFHIGVLYEQLAKYDQARRELELSAACFEKTSKRYDQARALNRLAYVARRQRHFNEAFKFAEIALELSKDFNYEQAYSYLVFGSIAFDQREWQKAKNFFEKSLTLWEETNDNRKIAWALINLGTALRALENYNEAIACYDKAIKLFETTKDPVHQAVARMNLGNIYLLLDSPSKALDFYLLAEPIFYTTQNRLRLAKVNNNKGSVYQDLQEWDKAKRAYLFSIEYWQEVGNIKSLVNSMDEVEIEDDLCG